MIAMEHPSGTTRPSDTKPIWLRHAVALLALHAVIGTICLRTVPRVFNDDAWLASLGDEFAKTHTLRHPIIHGWGGMHVHFVQNQVVLPFVCAGFFKVFGFSIPAARLGSLLFGGIAVVSLYGLARRWFGGKQAFWIAIALLVNLWFFEISRRIRPEIYYTASAIAALWCLAESIARRSAWLGFLSGIGAGLAALAHPSGLLLDVAIILGVFFWLPRRSAVISTCWAITGFVFSVLPYLIYVGWAVGQPEVDFWAQMSGKASVGLSGLDARLAMELRRWKNFFQWPKGLPLAAVALVTWVTAWIRSSRHDKLLATVVGIFALLLPFFTVNSAGRYLAPMTPFLAVLLVRSVYRLSSRPDGRAVRLWKTRIGLAVATALVYATVNASAIGLMFYRLGGADVTRMLDRIAETTGPDARVYGDIMLWFAQDRFHYGPFPLDSKWDCTIDMVRPFEFDYVVRGAWSWAGSRGVSRPPQTMPPTRSGKAYDLVAEQYGTKVDDFYDPDFGMIEIYKINWNRTPASGPTTAPFAHESSAS